MISDFSEAATFIFQKLPQCGTFLEIAKVLTKILPQFGMSVFLSWGRKNFAKNFAPVWMLEPFLGTFEVLSLLWFPEKYWECCFSKVVLRQPNLLSLLLSNNASKLGFDNLCLCRVDVSSENALISSIKLLTMLLNKNCPSSTNRKDVGSWIYFLGLAFEGLYSGLLACGLEREFRLFGLWTWHQY